MDSKLLIKKLHQVFCNSGKVGKGYTKVWLDPAVIGDIYNSGKYVLNVKANHKIVNCSMEIDDIFDLLATQAKDELNEIWRVYVYHQDEPNFYCDSNLIVYEEEKACS